MNIKQKIAKLRADLSADWSDADWDISLPIGLLLCMYSVVKVGYLNAYGVICSANSNDNRTTGDGHAYFGRNSF